MLNSLRSRLLVGGAAVVISGLTFASPVLAAGANTSGAYDANYTGAASGNGNGNAALHAGDHLPLAGSVGNADGKNPPGQYPDGSDANNGYECDGNGGIGLTNPAHTGCTPVNPV